MSEPQRQIEVQLGHLCNNRCVFCVSGQLSEQDRAPQLPPEPIERQIRAARASGSTKITFLGGEPTIQRSFPAMLQLAVDLEFEEIVIFTNGVMTPRQSFRDRALSILDGLGPDAAERVIWRFSLQGGDRETHDATTCNPGAWDRIIESMQVLADRGARISGNMCVVAGNHASVPALAAVARKYGLENLHLDMFRPRDSGDRTEAYLRGLMAAPYADIAESMRALVAAVDEQLGPDFDLNIGNLPFCVAPDIGWRVHHDGEFTVTVAASGQGTTQEGFDKYRDKRSDKHKLGSCADCAFNTNCGGVFDLYGETHGHDEFGPVSAEQLWALDIAGHHFVHLTEQAVRGWADEARGWMVGRIDERAAEIDIAVRTDAGPWRLILRRSGRRSPRAGWFTAPGERFEIAVVGGAPDGDHALAALRSAVAGIAQVVGGRAPVIDARALAEARAGYEREVAAEQRRLAVVRRRAAAMVDRLRGAVLAGLTASRVRPATDRQAIEVAFVDGDAELLLTLDLAPPPPANRPGLSHAATGLADDRVAAFSRALGAHLKKRAPAARTPLR